MYRSNNTRVLELTLDRELLELYESFVAEKQQSLENSFELLMFQSLLIDLDKQRLDTRNGKNVIDINAIEDALKAKYPALAEKLLSQYQGD